MAWCLVVVASALAVVGLSLATNGPTVHTVGDGDYTCYAPYDIVLNGVSPHGMPADYGEVLHACQRAGERRFTLAVASEVAAGLAAAVATALIWRSSRRVSGAEIRRRTAATQVER